MKNFKPDIIFHLAAESHVDRSIDNPLETIKSNIIGTFNLLEAARKYWNRLNQDKQNSFRFIHISTDEVFGSLDSEGFFNEITRYDPQSPYSASKASSDHLVKEWHRLTAFQLSSQTVVIILVHGSFQKSLFQQ